MATRSNLMSGTAVAPWSAPTMNDGQAEEVTPESYVPEGYDTVEDFLEDARRTYQEDLDYDRKNREMGMDDLRFIGVDQWDPAVRASREEQGRPCITVNTLNQFIGQVIGDRRINKTSIRVRPVMDATIKEAEVRSGLIKGIEYNSRAERVYDAAQEDQVGCGIGNFRIVMDYANDDVFLQDIFIRQIPNPFAAVWDRMSIDPTGRDASHVFLQDLIPKRQFESQFKDERPDEIFRDLNVIGGGWFENDVVRVCEWWRMIFRDRLLALSANGSVIDVTDKDLDELVGKNELYIDPATQMPRMRKGVRRYANMHLITGSRILAGPYELPITRLPVIRVNGREVRVGEDRVRFGLVRWAKDPARMRNYWRSIAVEKLAMAPKTQWLAEAGAIEGYEDDFRDAHISGDPLLKYADGKTKPERVQPPSIDAAILQEVQMNTQDIKDTTGLQDASLGIRSNEVSGKAIMARQQEGDVATIIYHDNLNQAIQEGGDVINQLLPIAYDTTRIMRVIGKDDKETFIKINDPNDPESVDLAKGKYDVAIDTGPSYTTQRMFAAEAMLEAVKVQPELMQIAGDLIVEAQDWPKGYEIAERLKKAMPKELVGEEEGEKSPEEQQAEQQQLEQQQEKQQQLEKMQEMMAEAEVREKVANANAAEQKARQAEADADRAEAEAEKAEVESESHATLRAAEILRSGEPSQPEQTSDQQRGGVPRREARPSNPGRKPRRKQK